MASRRILTSNPFMQQHDNELATMPKIKELIKDLTQEKSSSSLIDLENPKLIDRLIKAETELEFWKQRKAGIDGIIEELPEVIIARDKILSPYLETYFIAKKGAEIENALFTKVFCWYASAYPHYMSVTPIQTTKVLRIRHNILPRSHGSKSYFQDIDWNPETAGELRPLIIAAIAEIRKEHKTSPPTLPLFLVNNASVGTPQSINSPPPVMVPRQ